MPENEKLVRDKEPQICGQGLDDPAYRLADASEMFDLLIAKLREETAELESSRDPEELADILEVVTALAGAIGATQGSIQDIRRAKAERAGGFEQRIVWQMPARAVGAVLILTGPPGSGKSTVAGLLARRFPRSVHLESDLFFHAIVGGYIEPWRPGSHDQNTVVMGLVGEVAAAYARAGNVTIVDGILLPGWFYGPVTGALRSAGLDVASVILRPPLGVCLERASSRTERPLSDPEVVEQLWRGFVDLEDLERVVIDNGEQTEHETVEAVLRMSELGPESEPFGEGVSGR